MSRDQDKSPGSFEGGFVPPPGYYGKGEQSDTATCPGCGEAVGLYISTDGYLCIKGHPPGRWASSLCSGVGHKVRLATEGTRK